MTKIIKKDEELGTCPKCGKQMRMCGYVRHVPVCKGIIKKRLSFDSIKDKSEILSDTEYKCKECGRILKSKNSFIQHFQMTHLKTKKIYGTRKPCKINECEYCKKQIIYLKLHKDTCYMNPKNLKICPICSKPIKDYRSCTTCSRECSKIYFNDLFSHKPGRGNAGWYKGYWCDSSWELAFVIYNLEHGILFERNKNRFDYEFNGEHHQYIPDFIMNNNYVEIKGWVQEIDKAKFSVLKNLTVLTEKEMKPYFDYVIGKYGRKFIDLYDIKILRNKPVKMQKRGVMGA